MPGTGPGMTQQAERASPGPNLRPRTVHGIFIRLSSQVFILVWIEATSMQVGSLVQTGLQVRVHLINILKQFTIICTTNIIISLIPSLQVSILDSSPETSAVAL